MVDFQICHYKVESVLTRSCVCLCWTGMARTKQSILVSPTTPHADLPALLLPVEVAILLRCSRRNVARLASKGALRSIRPPGLGERFSKAEILRFLSEGEAQP